MTEPAATLTIAALAYREGEHLRKCFASLRPLVELTGAESLVVLDEAADENTARIAADVPSRVLRNRFVNFSRQRNFALEAVRTRWVFFIDPDERMTPFLAQEIVQRLRENEEAAAYRVSRRNILFGKEVRHTGWYPDYQVRLLEVSKCRYDPAREVHEVPKVHGTVGTLKYPLIHFNYATWGQFLAKQRAYAPLEAKALDAAGHRARIRSFFGQPFREFKRRFIEGEGYRDGLLGLSLSVAMAAYKLLTYWHLYRLQRRKP